MVQTSEGKLLFNCSPKTFTEGRSHREPDLDTVAAAVLRTVAYADVFDYPLTCEEVHRYLVGVPASLSAVQSAVGGGRLVPHRLTRRRGYLTLAGREAIVETRLRRTKVAWWMWPMARRYGLSIASLPFVRMVAVTGTLAMNNVDSDDDIDYLVVTVPRRLWLARLLAIAYVYIGRLERVAICPNYLISLDRLEQLDHSLFTAHELAQMVPLYGLDTYHDLVQANGWARSFLPNAFDGLGEGVGVHIPRVSKVLKRGIEFVLAGRLGDIWERWESRVKIQRLTRQAERRGTSAAVFTSQRCKGHVDDHGSWVAEAYTRRLALLDLEPEEPVHTGSLEL